MTVAQLSKRVNRLPAGTAVAAMSGMVTQVHDSVRIGALVPLTRPGWVGAGRHLLAGLELAVDEINDAGGQFELVVRDTAADGGNLLLNVGPRGEDAAIPEEQLQRLEWLAQDRAAEAEAAG